MNSSRLFFLVVVLLISAIATALAEGIKVSSNGRYFVDKDNKPFLWLGDTQWELVTRFTVEEAKQFLDDRKSKGFNVVQAAATGCETNEGKTNRYNEYTWDKKNPATPNESYFKRIDTVIDYAASIGIHIGFLPSWGFAYGATLNKSNAKTYGKWLGNRYKNKSNIIWILGGDIHPDGNQQAIAEELANGIKESGDTHIITFHPGSPATSSTWFLSKSWYDFIMQQSWCHIHTVPELVQADYNKTPHKPIVMGEPGYEDGCADRGMEYVGPIQVHRMAYQFMLMGGAGYTYGQWPLARPEIGKWRELLDRPGAVQMKYWKQILTKVEWYKLIPDQSIFITNAGTGRLSCAAARHADSVCAIVYFAEKKKSTLKLNFLKKSSVDAFWFNPSNGDTIFLGKIPTNQHKEFQTPEKWEDAVLVLGGVVTDEVISYNNKFDRVLIKPSAVSLASYDLRGRAFQLKKPYSYHSKNGVMRVFVDCSNNQPQIKLLTTQK